MQHPLIISMTKWGRPRLACSQLSGFIVQLVKHCTGIAEVESRWNPLNFSGFYKRQLIKLSTEIRAGFTPTFRLKPALQIYSSFSHDYRACTDGAVVRALASHQCGPGSIPRLGVICGWSLLVLYSAPRGFSLGTPVFPLSSKTNIGLNLR